MNRDDRNQASLDGVHGGPRSAAREVNRSARSLVPLDGVEEGPTSAQREVEMPTPSDRRVISGQLFRARTRSVAFTTERPLPPSSPVRRPAHVAKMLALAHHLATAIERGLVADQAAVARKLGLTRARITQLLDLTLLAPDVQARILDLEAVDGVEPLRERQLRAVVGAGLWPQQRAAWGRLELKRPKAAPGPKPPSTEPSGPSPASAHVNPNEP